MREDSEMEQAQKLQEQTQKMLQDPPPDLRKEWLRQNNMTYLGLIGIGTIMVQPFLSDLSTSVDFAGKVCLIAFAVAIPLLAALVMVNWQETFRGKAANSLLVESARAIAQLAGFVGVAAGFWHIWWIAGVVMLSAGLVAVGLHSAGYWRVEVSKDSSNDPK